MKYTNLIILLLTPLSLWAGNKVGNGGDVVDCVGGNKVSARTRLLDFYEASERGKVLIKPDSADYKEILNDRLNLLSKVAPKLSNQYKARFLTIADELNFKSGIALSDVKDSLHAGLPDDDSCRLKQIVIREDLAAKDEKRFLVDKTLWEKLKPADQAGLILHEIIYEHFSKLGESDSRKARRLNSLLFAEDFGQLSSGKFWLFVKDLSIPVYP